jgi:hypothetical protein
MGFNFDCSGFAVIGFGTSACPRCDQCRRLLVFRMHRYWRMRFCSASCMSAYQQRLTPETRQKILKLDIGPSWRMAS